MSRRLPERPGKASPGEGRGAARPAESDAPARRACLLPEDPSSSFSLRYVVSDPILIVCAVVIAVSGVGIMALMRPPRRCVHCGHRWARHDEHGRCRVRGGKVVAFTADYSRAVTRRTRCGCPGYSNGS